MSVYILVHKATKKFHKRLQDWKASKCFYPSTLSHQAPEEEEAGGGRETEELKQGGATGKDQRTPKKELSLKV